MKFNMCNGLYVLLKQNALQAKVKSSQENGLKLSD